VGHSQPRPIEDVPLLPTVWLLKKPGKSGKEGSASAEGRTPFGTGLELETSFLAQNLATKKGALI